MLVVCGRLSFSRQTLFDALSVVGIGVIIFGRHVRKRGNTEYRLVYDQERRCNRNSNFVCKLRACPGCGENTRKTSNLQGACSLFIFIIFRFLMLSTTLSISDRSAKTDIFSSLAVVSLCFNVFAFIRNNGLFRMQFLNDCDFYTQARPRQTINRQKGSQCVL